MNNILERINKAALKFLVPLTPEKTYEIIAKEAVKLVEGSSDCGIYFRDRKTGKFYLVNRGYKPEVRKHHKKGLTYKAFKTGKSFILYKEDVLRIHPEVKNIENLSRIFVPLSYQNKSIGVLVIRSKQNIRFSKKELRIFDLFGSMASLAIRKTQLYDETKQALETRDLFISTAAHELRTPLTSINGYIKLLYDSLSDKRIPESKWSEHLLWESIRLTNLINEFLEINKIKTGKLQYDFKESSLKEIINRTLLNFNFVHKGRKVVLRDNLLVRKDKIIADFDKLIQVFTNILDNAAKFSPKEKEINVNISEEDDNFIIEIKDKGKGILKNDLSKLFTEFYRGKNAQHEGMGIGLYLAKHIIEQHKGSINIQSELNKGTSLIIKLPQLTV
jgi:signal transduction histidine kinase